MRLNIDKSMYQKELSEMKYKAVTMMEELKCEAMVEHNVNTGWLNYPKEITQEEIDSINKVAKDVRNNSDVFVVIGIGGSYLGAKAVIEALTPKYKKNGVEVLFAGNSLSSSDLYELMEYLEEKRFSINVISKSGATIEPSIAFRILKDLLYRKFGEAAKDRIIVTTDSCNGSLRKLVNKEGYRSFMVPNNIGGRYSVLTPVGLLPIAVAGLNIEQMLKGAVKATKEYINLDFENNDALKYASMRNILNKEGKIIEIMATYEPRLHYLSEWWKQLFGESECKGGKGILPMSANFTTDLHSLGQAIQDGPRNIFETVLTINKPIYDLQIPKDELNIDELNYLSDKTVNYVNQQAEKGTIDAHYVGNVPVIQLEIDELTEETLGHLMYFYMISCSISCYILGVNPFNQPGVEKYKRNMFELLGK